MDLEYLKHEPHVTYPPAPPFDSAFEYSLMCLCNRHNGWPDPVLPEAGGFMAAVAGIMSYQNNDFARAPEDHETYGRTLGGVVLFTLAKSHPPGSPDDVDEFETEPFWYSRAAEFLQNRGWYKGEKSFRLEADVTNVWYPPSSICEKCPVMLACKTKSIT